MATRGDDGADRLRRAVDRSSKKSASRAVAFLVLATAAAIGAAALLLQYVDEQARASNVPTEKTVVANIDLPLGTALLPDHLKIIEWPMGMRPEGSFNEAKTLEGRVVIDRIYKGEPLLASKLASPEGGAGMAAVLAPGSLAVAVKVDDVVGVAGFIRPGNRVDVIVTMQGGEGLKETTSKIVLQNLEVLAVGKHVDQDPKDSRKPIQATVATLVVTPQDAERLALAAARGRLLLALRSSLDQNQADTKGISPPQLFTTLAAKEVPRSALARSQAARAPAVAPEREKEVVEILRGDLIEQRKFDKEKTNP